MEPHDHAAPAVRSRAFALGMALNAAYILAEAFFGLRYHSLALLSDAGHNLGDVLGLGLAWGAALLAVRPPSGRHTYGLRRASVLAALVNAILLLVAVGAIALEAVQRFRAPQPVAGAAVMAVAGVGVAINAASALLFLRGRDRDLNVRGAFTHMAADAAVSLGVVLAGLVILRTGWLWLDPLVSLLIAVAIVRGTWDLLQESVHLAMDAVPRAIDSAAVDRFLRSLPGVTDLHDLHIWGMSTTETALTAHLVVPEAAVDDDLLCRVAADLHARFGIDHTTIQLERGDGHCVRSSANAV